MIAVKGCLKKDEPVEKGRYPPRNVRYGENTQVDLMMSESVSHRPSPEHRRLTSL
jgi:hypothetical protein